jgi:hypothetical protein
MAKIEFVGFVMAWKYGSDDEPNPSWGMKVSESHSKMNAAGGWDVEGYTNFTVKAAYQTEIDFTSFKKGDRVKIIGTQKTEKNGEYTNLIVKASQVTIEAKAKPAEISDAPF